MRAVWQRVSSAEVRVDGNVVGAIGPGALVLLGVHEDDTEKDAAYIADKCVNLRVFPDESGKMNLSLKDVGGGILMVSQFTLYGDCRKGRRPSFSHAAAPDKANRLYELVCSRIEAQGVPVEKGVFQADMKVSLVNDGPVTLLLDSFRGF
jgi:D-tyrosyl-tRNA(Tyr) deacylase